MKSDKKKRTPQRVTVFQQKGSGERKIEGVRKYAGDRIILEVISIDLDLPTVLDDSTGIIPDTLDTDLVIDYLAHEDLSMDLAEFCVRKGIPIIATGKKTNDKSVHAPPTCCGLPRQVSLGEYGELFGSPEFEVELRDNKVVDVRVVRGAPCCASWEAARRVIGTDVDDAARKIGLDTQFYCFADPAGWDPIYGKSPVHFAGKMHSGALAKAIEKARISVAEPPA